MGTRPVTYVGPSAKPVRIAATGQYIRRSGSPPVEDVPVEVDLPEAVAERLVARPSFEPAGWQPDGEPVPGGPVDDVLAWVDGDPQRAARAAAAELNRPGGPRKTLLPDLQAIAGDGGQD